VSDSTEKTNPIDPVTAGLIKRKARELVGRTGITQQDREDIEQDLTLELIRRLPAFDEKRARRPGFAGLLLDRAAADILRRRRTAKRDTRTTISLDAQPSPEQPGTPLDGTLGCPDDLDERIAEMDFDEIIATLPDDLRRLVLCLLRSSVAAAARELGISRATIYRRLQELQLFFQRLDPRKTS
jgi:RNA polymerase sigma-70 factor (ECF subfamily)